MRIAVLLLGFGVAAGACGCRATQTYSGDRLPRSQVAILEAKSERYLLVMYQNRVRIRDVDGFRLQDFSPSNSAEILPGFRVARVMFERDFPTGRWTMLVAGPIPIEFAAQAGHVYEVRGRARQVGESWTVRIWIQDVDTGDYVADVWVDEEAIDLREDTSYRDPTPRGQPNTPVR